MMELYSALIEREQRQNKFFAAVMGADIGDEGGGGANERRVSLEDAQGQFGGIGIQTVG